MNKDIDFSKLVPLDPDVDYYKQCPECGGDGRVEYERAVVDYVNGGYLEGYMDICETCDGAGEVELDYDNDCVADEMGNLYLKDEPQF